MSRTAAGNVGSASFAFVVAEPAPTSLCGVGPRTCKGPGTTMLKIVKNGNAKKHRLSFRWMQGDATSADELGDPMVATQYAVCVWDGVDGTPSLVMEIVAEPAGSCAGGPCWRPIRKGNAVRYKDPDRAAAGLKSLRLKHGAAGTAAVIVKARGAELPDPPMPFQQSPRITVQVVNDLGNCWGADYVHPARVSTDTRLVAKETR